MQKTLDAVSAEHGTPKVFVHNAVGGAFGNFLEIDPAVLNRNFQVTTMALLHLARRLAPAMVAAGGGAIAPDEFLVKPAAIPQQVWHSRIRAAPPGRSTSSSGLFARPGERTRP